MLMSARMPARRSSPNTLTKGSIRTQVELLYGNGNRRSGNVVATAASKTSSQCCPFILTSHCQKCNTFFGHTQFTDENGT